MSENKEFEILKRELDEIERTKGEASLSLNQFLEKHNLYLTKKDKKKLKEFLNNNGYDLILSEDYMLIKEENNEKICPMCKFPKALSEYHKDKNGRKERTAYCKVCSKIRWNKNKERNLTKHKEYIANNSDKVKNTYLKNTYGITLEDYNNFFEQQKGLCAICNRPETLKRKNKQPVLSVDHNHETKEVRGLLCSKCNTGLGSFEDNKEFLKNAIKYIDGL
jgi:hypothetical protein